MSFQSNAWNDEGATHDANRASGSQRRPARAVLFGALIATAIALLAPTQASSAASAYSVEELLELPEIGDYITRANGDIAWVEKSGPASAIFMAKAPNYDRQKIASYTEDDGQPVSLIGFSAEHEVIFLRGRWGYNPSYQAFPTLPALFAAREGADQPKPLMQDIGHDFGVPVLSPESRFLYFSRGGLVNQMDLKRPRGASALFSVRGRVTRLLPSPDGRRLAFVSDHSDYERGKYAYIGVYDVDRETIVYMEPGFGVDQDPVWSPDSQRLAFIRFGYEPRTWRFSNHREGAPFDVMVVDAATGRGAPVFTSEIGYGSRFNGFGASGYSGLGGKGSLQWLADDRLLFPYEKTGWKHLYAVSANGGAVRQVTSGAYEVHAAFSSKDRHTVYYLANSEENHDALGLFALSIETDLKPSARALGEDGAMPLSAQVLPGGGFVYESASGKTPSSLQVAVSPQKSKQVSTGPKRGDPITKRLPAPDLVTFAAKDGLTIEAVLVRPPVNLGEGSHPALVISHGGPRTQDRTAWRTDFPRKSVERYFAGKGYFVLSVNFRSGTGYGLNFREPKSYGGRGGGDAQDIIDAARFLAKRFPEIDPARIAVFGHSYGGHNVTNALARSDVYAAGVSSAGVGDWVVEMEKDFREVLQFNIPERLELEALAHNSSAISKIDEWGTEPLLLIHGDNDRSAAMQQSLELYHALRRRGIATEAVSFPGEDHSFSRHASRLRFMEAIDSFLNRYVGQENVE
ncbi:MAG: alpha/beta fold hydrolase [Pseudomonadota bacterium]